jgi:hypothetical protein
MLRVILALVSIVIVGTSLASRLSEVRAAGDKSGNKPSQPITRGYDLKPNKAARTTASGKHIPKGTLTIRKAGKGQQE